MCGLSSHRKFMHVLMNVYMLEKENIVALQRLELIFPFEISWIKNPLLQT